MGTEGTLQIDDWDCGQIVRAVKNREDTWARNSKIEGRPIKTMAPRSDDSVDVIPISAPEDVVDNLNPTYWQLIDTLDGKWIKN